MDKAAKKIKEIEIRDQLKTNAIMVSTFVIILGIFFLIGSFFVALATESVGVVALGIVFLIIFIFLSKKIYYWQLLRITKIARKQYKGILRI
jgi:hypothetical protein